MTLVQNSHAHWYPFMPSGSASMGDPFLHLRLYSLMCAFYIPYRNYPIFNKQLQHKCQENETLQTVITMLTVSPISGSWHAFGVKET